MLNYLTTENQVVSFEGSVSRCRPVRHGVPQGSILGPLFFIILINALHLDNKTLIFADDTTLMNKGVKAKYCLRLMKLSTPQKTGFR